MFQVAVVIPVWNGEAVLGRCLDALARQTLSRSAYQIIVVDNGSSDATRNIARSYPGVDLLEEKQPGSYVARNLGIGRVRAPITAFTDADCEPAPDWLEQILRAAEANPGFGVLAGKIELFDEIAQEREVFGDYERLFSFPQAHAARGNCATANWASETAVLKALDGFDAALKSGGDRQMALRIRDAGYPLVYVPTMVVRHPVRASRAELVRKRQRLSGGRWDRTRQRPRLAHVLGITAVDTVRRLRRAAITRELPLRRRLAVMGLTLQLAGVAVGEFLNLAGGRKAARD
ncbi:MULTISPECIES: glycosyltransferase family 2 protein [unclassified Sphingopyxis]|uniref:glycosyltransferase n=1 Tax=unclassified Sphingopyxis TaxID=2614943 RepID=UPI0006BF7408|nr:MULTISPECIES: glycosyltransferase family A protein [unclassified Sphingopyxis]USI75888.1 glycosyltransferase family 2 protein [Sphingopyxis sp. USTB-05]GAO77573.1 glycosyl transferase, group 2 family protein [Sphingopyxis sp. C-1]